MLDNIGNTLIKDTGSSGILSDIGKALILLVATDNALATEALSQFPWYNKEKAYQLPDSSIILGVRTFLLLILTILMIISGPS